MLYFVARYRDWTQFLRRSRSRTPLVVQNNSTTIQCYRFSRINAFVIVRHFGSCRSLEKCIQKTKNIYYLVKQDRYLLTKQWKKKKNTKKRKKNWTLKCDLHDPRDKQRRLFLNFGRRQFSGEFFRNKFLPFHSTFEATCRRHFVFFSSL